ncbi:unnamed protein product [Amoebophrya sp. A120]|nr:unnamed protein product [Amoebophrya sp. A120]|eukprot:GSA120T00001425001.1
MTSLVFLCSFLARKIIAILLLRGQERICLRTVFDIISQFVDLGFVGLERSSRSGGARQPETKDVEHTRIQQAVALVVRQTHLFLRIEISSPEANYMGAMGICSLLGNYMQ